MKNKKNKPDKSLSLREQAEKQLTGRQDITYEQLSFADSQKLIHEMKVHQIELELQNEELQITRNRLEEILEKFTNLYEFAPVGYITIGKDFRITQINLYGSSLLGTERLKLINSDIRLYITGESLTRFNDFMSKIFTDNTKQSIDVTLTNRDIFVRIEAVASGDECRAAVMDITEQKHSEDKIQKINKELYELNAAKDKFFSIIAHDLRNPFNNILNFSKLLIDEIKVLNHPEFEEFASIIYSSAKNTYNLLENLLEWAKTQTGRTKFQLTRIDLREIVAGEIKEVLDIAKSKNIELINNIPDKPAIMADKFMLETIFRNLLSNAIKFTNINGKVEIYASEKETNVEISVEDNGIGIPEEQIPKLFKIDSNYKTFGTNNEMGSGLGLILCKEFIEKHGGEIRVESVKGKGSCFRFTLPKR